jgi:hypothetical protein
MPRTASSGNISGTKEGNANKSAWLNTLKCGFTIRDTTYPRKQNVSETIARLRSGYKTEAYD